MQLTRFILTIIIFNIFYNITSAQAELCDGCYVWEFVNDKGERDETSRLLSNDIEDILSQYANCKVLQRSKYAKLYEQINNEKAIMSLSGVSSDIKNELKTIQAKRVVFGTVNRDFQGNISLRLSFENLQTSQVKSNTIFLTGESAYSFEKRRSDLIKFINSFLSSNEPSTQKTHSSTKFPNSKTPQTWEGTFKDPNLGPYAMILYIEYINGDYIKGKVNWPSLENGITTMEGSLIERPTDFVEESKWRLVEKMIAGKEGIWLRFEETSIISGNIDLNGAYYCHISSNGIINGIWFRKDSTTSSGNFTITFVDK